MPPSLPVALSILTFLSLPAAAAPDFAVMRECGPQHYERYQKASGFEKGDPAALAQKLELINGALDSAGAYADSISRPGSDAPALPPGCQLDEAKIKDEVYGGLADLRRKINDKAAEALPEEEKEPTRNLTAIEGELDAAMGEAKDFAELKSKIRGIVSKVSAAEGGAPESVRARILRIKKRVGAILVRISEKQSAGVSAFDQAIPADVLARDAKRVEDAKKRADAAKGLTFGGDKTDNTPNAGAGNAASGGRAAPRTNTPRGGAENAVIEEGPDLADAPAKKGRRPRVGSQLEHAIVKEDSNPSDGLPGVLTEAVKNSAIKPLGGAINPPSGNDANNYKHRKDSATRAIKDAYALPAMERDFALLDLPRTLGFSTGVAESADRKHRFIVLTKNFVQRRFEVTNGKLPPIPPGDVTPEEEAALEHQLEQLNTKGKDF